MLELFIPLEMVAKFEVIDSDGWCDGEMDVSFELLDTVEDAVQILARFLLVFLVSRDENLLRFHKVAGFIFVRHHHRGDVEFRQVVHKLLFAAQGKHLEYRHIGLIVAVFGSSVALGNPDGLLFFGDCVAHIGGNVHGVLVEVADMAAPHDAEHLVHLADIHHQFALHQIAAKGDFSGFNTIVEKKRLQDGGIQQDVAVVGDEHPFSSILERFEAAVCEAVGGFFYNGTDGRIHDGDLEIVYAAEVAEQLLNLFYFLPGE